MAVELYGADFSQQIGPAVIVAMFAPDRGSMKDDILVGLGGGTLSGRRLEIDYDGGKALLIEK